MTTLKLPESAQRGLRFLLPMLACAALSACFSTSTSQRQCPDTNLLHTDEKYSPFANYFTLDDPAHRKEIAVRALGLVGTEYRWGGDHPGEGMDCSGLVTYVVEKTSRRSLPHHAATIAVMTRPVQRSELVPGDLVFFKTTKRRHSHMGIYIGDNRFVHAPAPGQKVRVDSLKTCYYATRLDGAHTLAR